MQQDRQVDAALSLRGIAALIDILIAATVAAGLDVVLQPDIPRAALLLTAMALLGITLFGELLFGRTPGKVATRLRVRMADGRPLTPEAALLRNALRLVDALPNGYVLGGAVIAASRRRQRIGDRVAGTVVVPERSVAPPPASRRSASTVMSVGLIVVLVSLAAVRLVSFVDSRRNRGPDVALCVSTRALPMTGQCRCVFDALGRRAFEAHAIGELGTAPRAGGRVDRALAGCARLSRA